MSGILDREAVEEFRVIWRDEYGEDLSFERAEMEAERFFETMRLILTLADRAKANHSSASLDEPIAEMS